MNRQAQYQNIDTFRNTRNRQKKARNDRSLKFANHNGERWTLDEINIVLEHNMPDVEIAKQLGRSVQAVLTKRSKVLNER